MAFNTEALILEGTNRHDPEESRDGHQGPGKQGRARHATAEVVKKRFFH